MSGQMTTYTRQMAGQCRNGAERDRGRVYHAVPADREPTFEKAVCGKRPGLRSAGWVAAVTGTHPVTCPVCLKRTLGV